MRRKSLGSQFAAVQARVNQMDRKVSTQEDSQTEQLLITHLWKAMMVLIELVLCLSVLAQIITTMCIVVYSIP